MGKLVTFWSPLQGVAKVTSSMCAIAGMLGISYPEYEIAISHACPKSMTLEKKLDIRTGNGEKRDIYESMGVSALTLNGLQAMLNSEIIRRCAVPLFIKSLYLYPSCGADGTKDITFSILTEHLKQEFSAVFLDLEDGWKEMSLRYMRKADVVVVVLTQEPDCYDKNWLTELEFLEEKVCIFLVGGYLEKSRYGVKQLTKKIESRTRWQFAGAIPINSGYFDAMVQGRTLEFLLKNQLTRKNEENYEFIIQAKKTAECFRRIAFSS